MSTSKEKYYYSINEVSKITSVPPYTLRYWEKKYKFIRPKKGKNGKRLYKKEDLKKIEKLNIYLKKGMKLEAAIEQIKNSPQKDNSQILKEVKKELKEILQILTDLTII